MSDSIIKELKKETINAKVNQGALKVQNQGFTEVKTHKD